MADAPLMAPPWQDTQKIWLAIKTMPSTATQALELAAFVQTCEGATIFRLSLIDGLSLVQILTRPYETSGVSTT